MLVESNTLYVYCMDHSVMVINVRDGCKTGMYVFDFSEQETAPTIQGMYMWQVRLPRALITSHISHTPQS